MDSGHPCHHTEIKKLNRIAGQVDGVKKMIAEGRYCPDILTQLRAVRAAIKTVESNILETHLYHCVKQAAESGNEAELLKKLDELKGLFKRFETL
jgi:DNA-binding FrmR family transcriptional regulator